MAAILLDPLVQIIAARVLTFVGLAVAAGGLIAAWEMHDEIAADVWRRIRDFGL